MSNRDLLKRFADGTPLTPTGLGILMDAKLITRTALGELVLTTAGRMLLSGGWVPPGDSASCPDDDSYCAPPRFSGKQNEPRPVDATLSDFIKPGRSEGDALDVQVGGESDPHGKHQHETGAKLDAGKVRLGLVLGAFSNALIEVGKVGTYGAQKYTDNGWLDVPKGKARYTDALLRHIFAEANESHDPDTNLHHAAHAAWNALARLELILRKRGDE